MCLNMIDPWYGTTVARIDCRSCSQSPVVCMLRPYSEESVDITFFSLGGRVGVCEADLLLYFGAAQRRGVRLVAETAVPTVDIRHRGVSVSSSNLQLCNVSVGQTVSEALTIVNTSRVRFTCRLQVRFLSCTYWCRDLKRVIELEQLDGH
jgi:hypothetical protein